MLIAKIVTQILMWGCVAGYLITNDPYKRQSFLNILFHTFALVAAGFNIGLQVGALLGG